MRVEINKELNFIHNKDARVFDVEKVNNLYMITLPGGFKQTLKMSEYQKLMEASIKVTEPPKESNTTEINMSNQNTENSQINVSFFDKNKRLEELSSMNRNQLIDIYRLFGNKYNLKKEELISLIIDHEEAVNNPVK